MGMGSNQFNVHLESLSEALAREICTWRYEGLYSVYNLSDWEVVVSNCWELSSEIARVEYFVAIFSESELIGFGRIQEIEGKVSLGIGLKPELCGKGQGAAAMSLLIEEAKCRYPEDEIGLEVRTFNKRAKKCYEKLGFVTQRTYMKETISGFVAFEYMALENNQNK